MSVHVTSGVWLCHRCDARGKLREWYTERPRLSPHERRRAALRDAFSVGSKRPSPPPTQTTEERARSVPTAWRSALAGVRLVDGTPGEEYLRSRAIPIEVARASAVRYSEDWYGRPAVLFPIRDREGNLVACQGRYVDGRDDPKTRTGGRKSLGVFATPGALQAGTIVIAEGPLDALSLAVCGVPAMALAGTTWPDWLLPTCAFHWVALGTDTDREGDEAAKKLTTAFQARGARVVRLRPPGAKDWNEALQADPEGLCRRLRVLLPRGASSSLQPEASSKGNDPRDTDSGLLRGPALVAAILERFGGRRLPTDRAPDVRRGA